MRSIQPLSLEVPPMIVPLTFDGVSTNGDGMIAEADLMALLQDKIDDLAEIEAEYAEEAMPDAA